MTNSKTPEPHPKYIVITEESMHIPEQGHGYPASEHKYERIQRFPDEESLKQYIKKNDQSNRPSWQSPKKLVIYAVTAVDYTTEVQINLG